MINEKEILEKNQYYNYTYVSKSVTLEKCIIDKFSEWILYYKPNIKQKDIYWCWWAGLGCWWVALGSGISLKMNRKFQYYNDVEFGFSHNQSVD